MTSAALGIDFGTTACSACVLTRDGRHEISVPSSVAIDSHGEVVVGAGAERYALDHPERVVTGVKRLLGRKLLGPEASWLAGANPLELVPADNGDAWVRIGERRYSPEEITAYLLRHVHKSAETRAGVPIEQTVLAVPAFFDVAQRQSLLDAASIAGLRIRRFVESSAAAILEAQMPRNAERIAVVDVGGGYFDVSVLTRRAGGGWCVYASDGDTVLGGDDLDRRVVDWLIGRFYEIHGADLTKSPRSLHRLRLAARDMKYQLAGGAASVTVTLPMMAPASGTTQVVMELPPVSRDEILHLWGDELEALRLPCVRLFEDIGLGTEDLDELVLLGGSCQAPPIASLFGGLFRRRGQAPERWRALAAAGAARIAQRAGRGDELVQSTMPHSLGVKMHGGKVSLITRRHQTLPCSEQRAFATVRPDQDSLVLEVFQGENELARENLYLGRFVLRGLANGRRHDVSFSVDQCGLLAVTARDSQSAADVVVETRLSSGLSATEQKEIKSRLAPATNLATALERAEKPVAPASPVPRGDAVPQPRSPTAAPPSSDRAAMSEPPSSERPMRPRRLTRADTKSGVEGGDTVVLRPRGETIMQAPVVNPEPPKVQLVDADSLVGTTIGGRYELDQVLGQGGMGRVYRARHKILDKLFAVKVIHPELAANDVVVARFLREAQSAARIDSDHVIEILDFGSLPDGSSYFVMEYLEGTTLGEDLQLGALPLVRLRHIAAQITRGLAAAHALGIVHRDLKPNNIKLLPRAELPLVKILDFGIAKCATSDGKDLTLVSTIVGTPHYMAPEQVHGTVDGRTDIYSLGVLLYEMATGELPFDDESTALLLHQHRTVAPDPPTTRAGGADCPPELEAIILRCLEKKPEKRFQTAEELLEALAAVPIG
jgi:molecular chaperone DnaK (HSP70)/tRNA A-37 threonylcarbamoyl transferase component Bud32